MAGSLSGRVLDRDGDPCANCVVKSWGYNYSNFTGTRAEIEQKIEDLRNELNSLRPENFSTSKSIPGDLGDGGGPPNAKYVAAHTKAEWGLQGHNLYGSGFVSGLEGTDLSTPGVQFGADKTLILTVWDPTKNGLLGLQGPVNSQLPGANVGQKVTIQTLDPTGDVLETSTLSPTKLGSSGFPAYIHRGVVIDLAPGFYRIKPADGGVGYPIVVGNPKQIVGQYRTNLRDKLGRLSAYQKRINDLIQKGKVTPKTAVTNASGYFNLTFNSPTLDQTSLIAYSVPDALGTINPQDPPTIADIRAHYENLSLQTLQNASSFYTPDPTRSPTVSVPASNVTVGVKEVPLPQYVGANRSLQRAKQLLAEILGIPWNRLTRGQIKAFLTKDRQRLEALYNETAQSVPQSVITRAKLCAQVNVTCGSETGGSGGPTANLPDAENLTTAELRESIAELEQQLANLSTTLPSRGSNVSTGVHTISSTFTLAGQVAPANVSAFAIWGNGTRTPVPEQYLSVDQSTLSGVASLGTTTVRISDFPVDASDPNTVRFEVRALSQRGRWGRYESPTAANPTFSGTIPDVRAIRFSTLGPTVGEQVTARLIPAPESSYDRLTGVTVTAPNGSQVAATITNSNSTIQFTPPMAGVHEVAVTVADEAGNHYVEALRIRVRPHDIPRPPTVRAIQTQFGAVAMVGDGFKGGAVETSATGSRVTLTGTVAGDLDGRPHFYANSLSTARETTIEARVLTTDRKQLSQTVGVAIHTRPLGTVGEEVLVYRRGAAGQLQPITPSGSTWGAINTTAVGATILTYGEGGATVVVIRDPTTLETIAWDLRTLPLAGQLFYGGVPIVGLFFPLGGLGALAVLGLVSPRRCTRGER